MNLFLIKSISIVLYILFVIKINFTLSNSAKLNIKASGFDVLQSTDILPVIESMKDIGSKVVDSVEFSGKLCYVKNVEMLLKCSKDYNNINKYWILLFDSFEAYDKVYKEVISVGIKGINVNAGIFNSDKVEYDTTLSNNISSNSHNKNNNTYKNNKNSLSNERLLYQSVNHNDKNYDVSSAIKSNILSKNIKENSYSEVLKNNNGKSERNLIFDFISLNLIKTNFPIFKVKNEDFERLRTKYEVYVESENTFATVSYFRLIPIGQKKLGLIIEILKLILFVALYLIWKHLKSKFPNDIISMQSFIENLVLITIIKELIMIYFLVKTEQSPGAETKVSEYYILTIVYTIECITRTFICFIFVLISIGVGTFRQYLTRVELKKVVFLFIFIYLFFCVDQILDSYFGEPLIFSLDFKDIKSVIFITALYSFAVLNTFKSIKILNNKYLEIRYFASEYISSVLFKLHLLK
jgi:hypothetical protein